MPDAYTFLRNVPLFEKLPDATLEQICAQVQEVRLAPGEILFQEGSVGDQAYVIKEGQIEIFKEANGHQVQLAVRQSGEMIGEIALLESTPRTASGRALSDSLLLTISQEQFDQLLNASPSIARTMLNTITARLRSTEVKLNQSAKMAQLGALTAGIAHEMNNPASAVMRGAEQFKTAFLQFMADAGRLYALRASEDQVQALQELIQVVNFQAGRALPLDPIQRSDREAIFEAWLEEIGIDKAWEYAPVLAGMGYLPGELRQELRGFSPESLPYVIPLITSRHHLFTMLDEISQGAERISEIVRALKSYVYLDQAPVQAVSIQDGLENTLVILRHKIKQGVEIERRYDPALPPIQAYGSELNQVWTNLLDNAVDAMNGQGRLTLRTTWQDPWVIVDIGDSGPGIPPEVLPRLFTPFFTTKPLGQGTGLGLSISYNIVHKHGGEIKVRSQPGETHFEVWLPQDFEKMRENSATLAAVQRSTDEDLRRILEQTRTVAVVGLSDKPGRPSHDVPAYLQEQGYRILPVNPNLDQGLGETAYPDLPSLPAPPDLVLIFRPTRFVPEIVAQAVAAGAKAVWMQEGILHEAAAQTALQAGLAVVMDTCIRQTHKRLLNGSS